MRDVVTEIKDSGLTVTDRRNYLGHHKGKKQIECMETDPWSSRICSIGDTQR